MLALPEGIGALGLLLLAVGTVAGLGAGWVAMRAAGGDRAQAALLAVALALAVAVAPFSAWRIVQDFRYTSRIAEPVAERIGAYENYLDGSAFDDLARLIPPGDRYYVRVAREIEPESAAHAFRVWGLTALLPRRAATNPANADWIVTWGVDPRYVRLGVGRVWRIREPKHGFPAIYLARVGP